MTEETGRKLFLAQGELRGLLAAFAWANHQCNHSCTFTVDEIPAGTDLHDSLTQYFAEWTRDVSAIPLDNWPVVVGEALQRWLFRFRDLVRPQTICALTDSREQREMVEKILDVFAAGLQPLEVWHVKIDPTQFYECAWDDFAVRGVDGMFLLHLGVSD